MAPIASDAEFTDRAWIVVAYPTHHRRDPLVHDDSVGQQQRSPDFNDPVARIADVDDHVSIPHLVTATRRTAPGS